MKKSVIWAYVVVIVIIIVLAVWYNQKTANDAKNALLQGTQPTATADQQQSAAVQQNQQTIQQLMNELTIKDTVVGTGATAVAGETVTVNYTGKLDDGTVFDSSLNPGRTPYSFVLGAGKVIQGWDLGVAGMKVGGTRELTIPPDLGYGSQDYGPIPANSTLHFTVTLLSVQ